MARLHPSERPLSDSEMVIHRLYEITSRYQDGFAEQVREMLRLGLSRFELDIGIVSRVDGTTYEVVEAVVPDGTGLKAGDRFELGATYCSAAIEARGPVGFEHVAKSEMATHPAYAAFGLESYIGTPITVGGEIFGTLNFSSPMMRERAFRDVDVDCLMLMERWVATELERRDMERRLEQALGDLERLVRTDPLTELANRRGLVDALDKFARRSKRTGQLLSCILLDIDDFKSVNDRFGHSVGDRVIRAVADELHRALRPGDVAGRVGGDEFLAVLPGATVEQARAVGERVRDAVRRLGDEELADVGPVTVSIGAAAVSESTRTVTDIMSQVEAHLMASKTDGKDRVTG